MKARSIFILLLALLAASMAVGCGGSDEGGEGAGSTATAAESESSSDDSAESTITASSLSKAAFVKKANSICAQAETQLFDVPEQPQGSENSEEEELVQRLGPALESIADGIRGVGAPGGDEAQVEAIVVAFERAAEETADSGPSSSEAEALLVAPSDLADEYGLRRCVFK